MTDFTSLASRWFVALNVSVTLVIAVALIIGCMFRRHAAIRETVLRIGIWVAMLSPLIAVFSPGDAMRQVLPEVTWSAIDSVRRRGDAELEAVDVPTEAMSGPLSAPTDDSLRLPADPKMEAQPSAARTLIPTSRPAQLMTQVVMVDWRLALFSVWLIGAAVKLVKLTSGMVRVKLLLRRARKAPGDRPTPALAKAIKRLGWREFPAITVSSEVKSPVVAGFLRPQIFLPKGWPDVLTVDELCMILMHEAAHVRRKDQLNLLVEHLFLSVFWFHPLAHLIGMQVHRAREFVCDNFVIREFSRTGYSQMLLKLSELIHGRSSISYCSIGLFAARPRLDRRVAGLLNEGRETMVKTGIGVRIAVFSLMFATGWAFSMRPLMAEQEKEDFPARVAVFNINRVHDEVSAFVNAMNEMKNSDEVQVGDALSTQLAALQKSQKALPADSPAHREIERMIREQQVRLEVVYERFKVTEMEYFARSYKAIYEEVGRYANETGIDLVMRDNWSLTTTDPAEVPPTDESAVRRMRVQPFLFLDTNVGRETVDITDEIIRRLEEKLKGKSLLK